MPIKPDFGNQFGHGRLGLRSSLKPFAALLDQSASTRHILAQVQPVLVVEDWSLSSGSIYVAPFDYNYGGVRRDVVSASAVGDLDLTRAETATLSSGEYYYDPNEVFTQEAFKYDQSDGRWQIAAWTFDGSTDYWETGAELIGMVDRKTYTFSCWFRHSKILPTASEVILGNASTRFVVYIDTSGKIIIHGKTSGDVVIANSSTTASVCDGEWHYIIATGKLNDTNVELYLDGVSQTITTETDGTIDFTTANWAIGALPGGAVKFNGDIGQLWFNNYEVGAGASDSTVRDYFYDSTNHRPIDLGPSGQVVSATNISGKPKVYLYETVIGKNSAAGGDFPDQGSTVVAETRPNQSPGLQWDQFPQLYVNLTDDSSPADSTVVAHLGFHFATKAQSHPTLGPDLLAGIGDFEAWTAGVPDGWTNIGGDATLTEETTDVWKGNSAFKLSLVGGESLDYVIMRIDSISPITGAFYRYSGYYKTEITSGPTTIAFIRVYGAGTRTTAITTDGRSIRNINMSLTDTDEYWRFFCFDFYWDGGALDGDMRVEVGIQATSGVCSVLYDDVQLRRIWRYEFYEPRLTKSAIPATSSGSNDIFFGGKRTSTGNIGFLNQDKFWEVIGGQLEWINQRSTILVGGQFMSDPSAAGIDAAHIDGQEILINDMRTAYSGLIQGLTVKDATANLAMQDIRTHFHTKLPKSMYLDTEFTNLHTADWQGKLRPVFFGLKKNITPARIAYEATSAKYGQYELCDTTDAPNGIKSIDAVYAYTSKTAADLKDTAQRLTLVEDTDYTTDLANGRFDIDLDVGPYKLVHAINNALNFNDGGDLTAWLTLGSYTGATLAAEIQSKMDALSSDTITCTYSETTNKFTIATDGITLNLLLSSGAHEGRSVFSTIGFTDTADKTGSTSYAGDDATFSSADTDHIIRVDAQGYKDDASGTVTGSANALIEVGTDICKTLLIYFMDRPSGIIHAASFSDSQSRAAESLAMYLNTSTSTKEIFERLEFSNIANIVIDGEGLVHYEVYVGTVPTNITTIYDRDIQSFEAKKGYQDIYQTIRVLYDEDPTTGTVRAREATDTSVGVRLGRQDLKEFPTYLKFSDNAISVANRMLTLSQQAARIITMGVLGGSLIDHKVGDKIRIERERGLDSGGALTQDVFRILSIKKDYLKGLVTVDVTDDRVTVASEACITSCQFLCKVDCQLECEKNCQETCKLDCQIDCKVACKGLCEETCQETCQLGCLQIACELSCKTGGCESVCQDCEGAGCQTDCEAGGCSEAACELGCQTDCKLQGCQTVCQLEGCNQSACQTAPCQNDCQLGLNCQTTCQLDGCQDACVETASCQDVCMTSCKTVCMSGNCQTEDEGVI